MKKLLLLILLISLSDVYALDLTRAKRRGTIRIDNCPIVEGVSKIKVHRGKVVELVTNAEKKYFRLRNRYRYFACTTEFTTDGSATLVTSNDRTIDFVNINFWEHFLDADDFKTQRKIISRKCPNISGLSGSFIYKTIGSGHFNDVRRNTIGLILKTSFGGSTPGCVPVLDQLGFRVGKLSLYATGGEWRARYYAGVGCSANTPFNGETIARRAKRSAGSKVVYFDFGNVCYGPQTADRCRNSKQC